MRQLSLLLLTVSSAFFFTCAGLAQVSSDGPYKMPDKGRRRRRDGLHLH